MDDITRISSNEWLWYETKKMLLHCRERLDERRLDEERRSPTLRRAGRPIYYSVTIDVVHLACRHGRPAPNVGAENCTERWR